MRLTTSSTASGVTFTCQIRNASSFCREILQKAGTHVYANAPYLAEQFTRFSDADVDVDACTAALRKMGDELCRTPTAASKEQFMDSVWYAATRQPLVRVTSVSVHVSPGRSFDVRVRLQNPMGGAPHPLRIEGWYE